MRRANKTFNPNYALNGKILLASPAMSDPRFSKAVIFVCAHDENGAMGLVINNPIPDMDFSGLLSKLEIKSDIKITDMTPDVPVLVGGPVDASRGFLLHSNDFNQSETVVVNDHCSVTGTLDALAQLAQGKGPEKVLFVLGHAGWGAGQLEQEVQENAWMILEPDDALIYNKDNSEKWLLGMNRLGFDPAMISAEVGHA